jgi:hypothetical protein
MAYGMAWLRGPGQDQVAQLTVSALVVVAPHCDAYDLAEQFVPWNRQLASCGEGSTPFGSLGGHTPMMGMRPAGLMTSAIALVTQCGTSLLKSLSERGWKPMASMAQVTPPSGFSCRNASSLRQRDCRRCRVLSHVANGESYGSQPLNPPPPRCSNLSNTQAPCVRPSQSLSVGIL